MTNKIEAINKSISSLLKDQKFYIDYFQREYRWQEKHIKLLVDDLTTTFLKSYKADDRRSDVANYQSYYLGPVVFSVNSGNIDLTDRNLMNRCGLELSVPEFDTYRENIIEQKIPLNRLSSQQVIDLRNENKAFFRAAKNAIPDSDFWRSNKDLAEATKKYINDIAKSIPISKFAQASLRGAREAIVAGGASSLVYGFSLVSNSWFAGAELAPLGFPIVWWAQKGIKPIAKFLTSSIDERIENMIQDYRSRGYADLLFNSMDLSTQMPESITNKSK